MELKNIYFWMFQWDENLRNSQKNCFWLHTCVSVGLPPLGFCTIYENNWTEQNAVFYTSEWILSKLPEVMYDFRLWRGALELGERWRRRPAANLCTNCDRFLYISTHLSPTMLQNTGWVPSPARSSPFKSSLCKVRGSHEVSSRNATQPWNKRRF